MMARSFGSFCSLLLLWLCALGAGPARHPVVGRPVMVRGAAELALRDAAEVPLVGSRAVGAQAVTARGADRDPVRTLSSFTASDPLSLRGTGRRTRTTLALQSAAHASIPRRRAYDAAAPPASSRPAR